MTRSAPSTTACVIGDADAHHACQGGGQVHAGRLARLPGPVLRQGARGRREDTDLAPITTPQFTPYGGMITAADRAARRGHRDRGTANFTLPAENFLYTAMTRDEFVRARQLVRRALPRVRGAHPRGARGGELAGGDSPRRCRHPARLRPRGAARHPVGRLEAPHGACCAPSAAPATSDARATGSSDPADSSNGFQNWLNQPNDNRVAFQMRTKDRRIQGAGGPASAGKYVGYNLNNIFAAEPRHLSLLLVLLPALRHRRQLAGGPAAGDASPRKWTCSRPRRSFASIGRPKRCRSSIATRVANGELPPVTIDGPPDEPGCVPRKQNGSCGSLWDALRYEKGIEGLGVDGVTAFFDARGWQTLPENTHHPPADPRSRSWPRCACRTTPSAVPAARRVRRRPIRSGARSPCRAANRRLVTDASSMNGPGFAAGAVRAFRPRPAPVRIRKSPTATQVAAGPDFTVGILVVGATGFEPATSCSRSRRSTGLSYAPKLTRLATLPRSVTCAREDSNL